jgi:hypothetical protein
MCNYCNNLFLKKENAIKHMKNNCKIIKQKNKEKIRLMKDIIY